MWELSRAERERLGLARLPRRQTRNRFHRQPGQSAHGQGHRRLRRQTDSRRGRLGTCLLPQIPEQARRLSQGDLECDQLGRSRQEPLNREVYFVCPHAGFTTGVFFVGKSHSPLPVLRTPSPRRAGRGTGRGALSFNPVTVEELFIRVNPCPSVVQFCFNPRFQTPRSSTILFPLPRTITRGFHFFAFPWSKAAKFMMVSKSPFLPRCATAPFMMISPEPRLPRMT